MSDAPMLSIGTSLATVEAAAKAIIDVLKVAGTEATSIAAMKALSKIAKSPMSATVSNCIFTNKPTPTKHASKR